MILLSAQRFYMNCWEFMKCGREPDGENSEKEGVCPASTDTEHNGVNNGKNAGRCCWKIAGTFCNGDTQGLFADKIIGCIQCKFFKKVQKVEGHKFKLIGD